MLLQLFPQLPQLLADAHFILFRAFEVFILFRQQAQAALSEVRQLSKRWCRSCSCAMLHYLVQQRLLCKASNSQRFFFLKWVTDEVGMFAFCGKNHCIGTVK